MVSYNKPNPLATFIKDDLDYFATLEDELFDCEECVATRRSGSSISFSEDVAIQEVTCISDMEISEIDNLWYTQEDFTTMKAECRQLAKSAKSARIKESADICIRGLEEKLNGRKKKINRSEAIGAVLCEQDAQFSYGEQNPEVIAQVYQEFASHCLDEAVEQALRDQEAALAIHDLPSNSSSLSSQGDGCTSSIPSLGKLGGRTMLIA
ncbi:unnamed protein product [Cylindrotheca closterium]|uniref:Uncharacterized protein n=1 Tax=Cylindrotheca closterium TaxID=2856 RepID=A0AAD2FYX1_9STRA|nr:unnamed protein product [Cylindrotheca closterium]